MPTKKTKKAAAPAWRPLDGLTREFTSLIDKFTSNSRVSYGGQGFGSRALRVDGRIFAMLDSRGRFVVKLPRPRADELLSRGQGSLFEPVPGRPMKQWVVVSGAKVSWLALAREAYEYVADL